MKGGRSGGDLPLKIFILLVIFGGGIMLLLVLVLGWKAFSI